MGFPSCWEWESQWSLQHEDCVASFLGWYACAVGPWRCFGWIFLFFNNYRSDWLVGFPFWWELEPQWPPKHGWFCASSGRRFGVCSTRPGAEEQCGGGLQIPRIFRWRQTSVLARTPPHPRPARGPSRRPSPPLRRHRRGAGGGGAPRHPRAPRPAAALPRRPPPAPGQRRRGAAAPRRRPRRRRSPVPAPPRRQRTRTPPQPQRAPRTR